MCFCVIWLLVWVGLRSWGRAKHAWAAGHPTESNPNHIKIKPHIYHPFTPSKTNLVVDLQQHSQLRRGEALAFHMLAVLVAGAFFRFWLLSLGGVGFLVYMRRRAGLTFVPQPVNQPTPCPPKQQSSRRAMG